jgi:hypothetical protein
MPGHNRRAGGIATINASAGFLYVAPIPRGMSVSNVAEGRPVDFFSHQSFTAPDSTVMPVLKHARADVEMNRIG